MDGPFGKFLIGPYPAHRRKCKYFFLCPKVRLKILRLVIQLENNVYFIGSFFTKENMSKFVVLLSFVIAQAWFKDISTIVD